MKGWLVPGNQGGTSSTRTSSTSARRVGGLLRPSLLCVPHVPWLAPPGWGGLVLPATPFPSQFQLLIRDRSSSPGKQAVTPCHVHRGCCHTGTVLPSPRSPGVKGSYHKALQLHTRIQRISFWFSFFYIYIKPEKQELPLPPFSSLF